MCNTGPTQRTATLTSSGSRDSVQGGANVKSMLSPLVVIVTGLFKLVIELGGEEGARCHRSGTGKVYK